MFIKRPRGKHRHYSLIGPDGKTIYDSRIDRVNEDLDRGVAIDLLEARMRAIRDSFKPQAPLSQVNAELAQICLQGKREKYAGRGFDEEAARARLDRAVSALGALTATEASEKEILVKIAKVTKPGRRYHVIGGINELLRTAKRDLRLHNPKPDRPDQVAHVTAAEFVFRCPPVKDYWVYLGALLATGCRFGELPQATFGPTWVLVQEQLTRKQQVKKTKNKKMRKAPLLPPLIAYVERWKELPEARRLELRLKEQKKIWKECKSVLGFTTHNLRHSYCIEWAKQGKTIAEIAKWIGDTEETCNRHYARYIPKDEAMDAVFKSFK